MIDRKLLAALCAAVSLVACRADADADHALANAPVPTAAPAVAPAAAPATSPAGLDLVPLDIRSANGTHHFTVEVARTPDQQSRGLMFRQALGADEGMVFPFDFSRPATFWMRNTLIPLDLIFIRENGTIARVAANAVPLSEDTIASGEPVGAVLEIKGGRAAQLGIAEGDRVTWQH